MLDCSNQTFLSLLFGCLACLVVTPVANADGRVFVLDLRNSSGPQGFRDAEGACASRHARLASAEELHHAVAECFFSPCTRGWLYGGTVGTTVCNVVGSALKAVDVRTENATEDAAHLDAFCIRDKGVPCGDPPSFPNARLQGHTGYEMGDELLYSCVPGYVMPSGHSAFSLLCDSCGEWYGLVEICVKDETESHVDYEDKFTDSYGDAERRTRTPEEAHGEVYEEVHGAAWPERGRSQEQQETSFNVQEEEEHQEQHGEHELGGEEISRKFEGAVERGEEDEDQAVPRWQQERREVVETDAAAATEAPVSLLSQKHLFWFPSEAFQEEGHPFSTNPVTQNTQRASSAQSEESKEHDSQETHHHQRPVDVNDHDHEQDSYDSRDTGDLDDHDDSDHDDLDAHDDSHHDDLDDRDSRQDENDDHLKHYIPAQHDDLDRRDRHEKHYDHNDHYDMGEHEEDRDRVRYGSQEYDDTYDEHEGYEEHDDVTDDRDDVDREHPDGSEERTDPDDPDDRDDRDDPDDPDDRDDHEEHYDLEEDDHHYTDHVDHDDHEHDDHDSYDEHDSHEEDGQQHVIFSIATDEHHNITQKKAEGEATTDDTWLDGYPVVPQETENGEDAERRTVVRVTDRPNEVEIRKPGPYTNSPEVAESPTADPGLDQGGVEEVWPGFIPTAAPSQPSDSPSHSDTLDYDTQQAAPTPSWLGDLTEHPFLDHGPVPPMHSGDSVVMGENDVQQLPGEAGERGEMEGEMGEASCTGDDCPPRPPSSSGRGPTVAAIIVAVCAVATAVVIGVWCYRRQQQKSSVYEMNGKGQSQTRQGQQIEMQQKV